MKSFFKCSCVFFILFFTNCVSPEDKIADNSNGVYVVDTVIIKQMKFIPADIHVHKGDSVIFINNDIVAHDVTEQAKAWSSDTLAPDKWWKMEILDSVNYYCTIHPGMTGKISLK